MVLGSTGFEPRVLGFLNYNNFNDKNHSLSAYYVVTVVLNIDISSLSSRQSHVAGTTALILRMRKWKLKNIY